MEANYNRWEYLDKFVGRANELNVFDNILNNPLGEKRTLYIQASGGQGKTWLIKKMLVNALRKTNTLALAPDRLIDMYSTSNRYLEGVLAALEQRFRDMSIDLGVFDPYYEAKKELETARAQEGYSSEDITQKVRELAKIFRNSLQALAKKQTIVLAFDTFENVSNSDVSDWILSNDGLQMPNVICLIGSRAPVEAGQRGSYSAVEELPLLGLSDEDAIKFYVSYTGAVQNIKEDFIRILNQKSAQNPLMLGLAIYYLDLPDNSSDALKKLSQEEFEKEVVSWLSPKNDPGAVAIGGVVYNEQMRQALIPMAYLNRRFNKFFLQKLADAGYLHLGDATVDDLWTELDHKKPDLFFVKERPDGEIQLHDKLAELLRKHVLTSAFDLTGERLRQFVDEIMKWYDELVGFSPISKEFLYAEQLAYLLRSDLYTDCQQQPSHEICTRLTNLAPQPKEITDVLDTHFRRQSDVLARLLINEAKIPLIEEFGGDERYRIYTLLGKIAEQCYSHEAARGYLQKAYQIAVGMKDPNKQVESLIDLHNSTFPIDPQKSLEILDTAEAICVDKNAEKWLPKIQYERGFTYYLLNDLSTSTTWYEKASSQAKRLQDKAMMPIILNDWGYNLLLTGDLSKGRISIRAARDLRYRKFIELTKKPKTKLTQDERAELAQELNDAQKMLGLSYSTLGDLARFSGRLNEAVTRYTEALNIFKKAGSHYWQARMHFTRGEAYRRIAAADHQAGRNAKSKRLDKQAEEDIDKSLLICDKYGFRRDSATAYRRLGRLYHDRMFRTSNPESQLELLESAKSLFMKALSIAEEMNDPIEIFENLTELAFLGDDYLDIVKVHNPQEIELAKKTSNDGNEALRTQLERYGISTKNPIYFFPVFQHLLEIEQAAFFFALGEYEQALPLYIKGYVGMAQNRGYGVARYLQHIDHLISHLHELAIHDKELAERWCNELLAAWEKAGLMDKRTELPQEIEMFLNTTFLYLE